MRTLILAAVLIGLAGAAQAGPDSGPPAPQSDAAVQRVMRSQKLMGVWAVDCGKPAGAGNPYETIALEGSKVVAILEEGERFVADVVTARRLSRRDTAIHLREREYGVNYHVVYRREGDRQMTWSSMDSDGEDLIVEGRLNNGEMGKWYQRCGPAAASTPRSRA